MGPWTGPSLGGRLLTAAAPGRFGPAELDGPGAGAPPSRPGHRPRHAAVHLGPAADAGRHQGRPLAAVPGLPGAQPPPGLRLDGQGGRADRRQRPVRRRRRGHGVEAGRPGHRGRRAGPDVSRSAAGRAGAEGTWLPTALLPRFGVRWSAPAGDQVTAAFAVGETPVELHLRLDPAGRILSLAFDRWGDPDGRAWLAPPGAAHRPRQLRRPDHPQRRPARLGPGRRPLRRRRVLPLPDHRAAAGRAGGRSR